MLQYSEILDGFEGDDTEIDDDDIMTIDDLIINDEADEDDNDPEQAYCEDFIGK
jgi:hypothetical protein